MEAEMLNACKEMNNRRSKSPNFQPCVLENPFRIKHGNEEIYLESFHKLKTGVLKELNFSVVGSTNHLEMLCSFELEEIIKKRKGEDSKLDKARRSTLNAFPDRRFKMDKNILKFRVYIYGQENWLDLQDAQQSISKVIQQYIDEIEDDALSPMEVYLVESLRNLVVEALKGEEERRKKRKSEAQK
ncbi:hypothetical protein POM88_007495 [Heracleum sosnowskyi]|uniref:Uncharacterized protein n=1 Tax=Heracleum sosnowskyi TaxID=360622 RepID=A0AAD8J810_9APIA|nr:hypothetical protein POM88_007495 [Heracleum sosnowskyi]